MMEKFKKVLLPFGGEILQTIDGQGISSDTQFLVETVLINEPKRIRKVLEFGSGNGIISIMLKANKQNWNIIGIEIQPHLVELSQQNAKRVNLDVSFIEGDIASDSITDKGYDIIVANPPYIKKGSGRESPNFERAISRQEIKCTMQHVLKRTEMELAIKGNAYLMYPQNRDEELIELTKNVDLKIDSRFISKSEGKKVFIVKLTRESD